MVQHRALDPGHKSQVNGSRSDVSPPGRASDKRDVGGDGAPYNSIERDLRPLFGDEDFHRRNRLGGKPGMGGDE